MWVLDLTVGCWELNLNLSLHVQLFEHLNFILRGPTKRELKSSTIMPTAGCLWRQKLEKGSYRI